MDIAENQSLESLEGALVALRYVQYTLNDEANKLITESESIEVSGDGELPKIVARMIQLAIARNNLSLAKSIGVQIDHVLNTITKTREIRESVKNHPVPKEGN